VQRGLGQARRIVVKVGSAVLAAEGELDAGAVERLADDIAGVRAQKRDVVLVSSGAIACGFRKLGLDRPPKEIRRKQAAAAVGQPRLMKAYSDALGRHGVMVAQVLVTANDINHRQRFLNARHTLETLLKAGVVPIVNENDSVSFSEIKLGDNDNLSAMVANVVSADLLVMLSSVDGLLEHGQAGRVISVVPDARAALAHVGSSISGVGVGGMATKLAAAGVATAAGIGVVVAAGARPGVLQAVLRDEPIGTYFPAAAARSSRQARKRWIGFSAKVHGTLVVDEGARRAILERGASLLPSGIVRVDGRFAIGAPVEVRDARGEPIARGLVSYSSDEIDRLRGYRTSEIAERLGYAYCDEIIHRDDMAILRHGPPAPAGEGAG
jgi:glutamate 5-kinase